MIFTCPAHLVPCLLVLKISYLNKSDFIHGSQKNIFHRKKSFHGYLGDKRFPQGYGPAGLEPTKRESNIFLQKLKERNIGLSENNIF